MTQGLVVRLAGIARVLRAVMGAPDYERYLEHLAAAHPDRDPMTCDQFMSERMNDRYSRPGAKCC